MRPLLVLILCCLGFCAQPASRGPAAAGAVAGKVLPGSPLNARGLDPFFKKLERLERKQEGLVRILFFGDSIISGDNLTSQLRQRFQARFGDGGAGLVNIVDRKYSRLRHSRNLTGGGFQLLYIPFSGLSMRDYPHSGFTGQSVWPLGRSVAVQYSNTIAAKVRVILRGGPGGAATRLNFRAGSQSAAAESALGPNECEVHEFTNGESQRVQVGFLPLRGRPYIDALVLENDTGVTLSPVINLGLHQAWMQGVLDYSFECGFRLFAPDLVVYQSGINEAATMRNPRARYTMDLYPTQLDIYYEKLARLRPGQPVLVIGPPERMIRSRRGWVAQPEVAPVAEHQADIAAKRGHSFFDTYAALGGEGHMLRMMQSGEAHGDGTHISFRGGTKLAGLIFEELMRSYEEYK